MWHGVVLAFAKGFCLMTAKGKWQGGYVWQGYKARPEGEFEVGLLLLFDRKPINAKY